MKRMLCLLLILVICIGLIPAAAAAEPEEEADPILINTPEALRAIAENPQGSYRLGADLDLNGEDWTPIPFSGRLDGNGHTIYNLRIRQPGAETATSVDGNHKCYESVYGGLFSVVKDAQIQNLNILGADVNVETDRHCFVAILAGYMENTTVTDCSVEGRVYLYTTNVMVGAGGLVGFGSGSIQHCTADVELLTADRRREKPRCEQFLGAMLACGNADIQDCTVEIDGYTSCWGYVHTGGLIGMYYRYDSENAKRITGNTVNGKITFFENNPDRRAYCAPYGGEILSTPRSIRDNQNDFTRNELKKQEEEIAPETCEVPQYVDTVVTPDCRTWGYTSHKCSVCGYEYRTDYTAPSHVPGEWEIIKEATMTEPGLRQRHCTSCGTLMEEQTIPPHREGEWQVAREPGYEQEGLRQMFCPDCGQLLKEEPIPVLTRAASCVPNITGLNLNYKDSYHLSAKVSPDDAADPTFTWSSSDSSIVSVSPEGDLTATGKGTAIITCRSGDGYASGSCTVTVGYTPIQWVIEVLLFGWLWY